MTYYHALANNPSQEEADQAVNVASTYVTVGVGSLNLKERLNMHFQGMSYTILVDDFQDGATVRDGRPTWHTLVTQIKSGIIRISVSNSSCRGRNTSDLSVASYSQ